MSHSISISYIYNNSISRNMKFFERLREDFANSRNEKNFRAIVLASTTFQSSSRFRKFRDPLYTAYIRDLYDSAVTCNPRGATCAVTIVMRARSLERARWECRSECRCKYKNVKNKFLEIPLLFFLFDLDSKDCLIYSDDFDRPCERYR